MLTEGERWAREQLGVLRDRRFSPPAVAAFLGESQRRAAAVRAARPGLARQARAWSAAGALAWLGFAAARGGPFDRRVRLGLGWWTACTLMLDWHLGMVESVDGRPRRLSGADALTLTRAWLVPLAWDRPTAAVCAVAGLTDALDGAFARRAEPTRVGRDFDGVVDACFGVAALRGALRHDLVGRRLVRAELARIGLGVGYGFGSYFRGLAPPDPVVTAAARALAPLRLAGLLALATARRRVGSALLGAGMAGSLALHAAGAVVKLARAPSGGSRASATTPGWAPVASS
jgi:hypothetical protein